MNTAVGVDHVAGLTHRQVVRCLFKGGLHLAAAELTQVTTTLCGRAVATRLVNRKTYLYSCAAWLNCSGVGFGPSFSLR